MKPASRTTSTPRAQRLEPGLLVFEPRAQPARGRAHRLDAEPPCARDRRRVGPVAQQGDDAAREAAPPGRAGERLEVGTLAGREDGERARERSHAAIYQP